MKRYTWYLLPSPLLMTMLIGFSSFIFFENQESTIDITISNLSGKGADIHLGFYEKGTDFPSEGKHTFQKIISVPKGESKVTATWNIPSGDYAIAIFEDLDGDEQLDKNFIGMPQEPYGFSQNFTPKLSAPDFEDCVVNLTTDKQLEVKLLN